MIHKRIDELESERERERELKNVVLLLGRCTEKETNAIMKMQKPKAKRAVKKTSTKDRRTGETEQEKN